ncbi:hypothetical protein E4N89_07750 [Treponema denticola]|uniref:hypothetical protein n=1 Tax=Treponema denticola TaxID=158 RepID=UPI003D8F276C
MLFPQQHFRIGLFVYGMLGKPRHVTRIVKRHAVRFTVECGDEVLIANNPPIFVYILNINTVIRNVDIIFVVADKTDGIGKILCIKGDGVSG